MTDEPTPQVLVDVIVENYQDVLRAQREGTHAPGIRRVAVSNAVVDDCVCTIALPKSVIEELGIVPWEDRSPIWSNYEPVRLTILDRECILSPALGQQPDRIIIGLVALTAMDLVVNSEDRQVTANPEDDEWIISV